MTWPCSAVSSARRSEASCPALRARWGLRRDGTQTPKAEQQLVTALAAGLNAQSLHHAMPSLSCAHFPRVYAEYATICERYGVKIRHSDHVGTAVASMLGYVFENNKPLRA